MEIRARYTLIGAFTLAVILLGFGFVYWMHNSGGLGERRELRIVFGNAVSGLLSGSPVYFNGIRVGEVTALRFRPDNPAQLEAAVSIHPATPLRTDTRVGLDFQGLTGVAVITLSGGAADAPPLAPEAGGPATLIAPPNAGESLTAAAQTALQRLNGILNDASTPLQATLDNIKSFSDALARNSDRVDGIMAGLERMTGGAGKAKATTFDLLALREFAQDVKVPDKQLVVPEVTAAAALDADRIVLRKNPTESVAIEGGIWTDTLPRLTQLRIVQSFENAGYAGSIGRPADGFTAENQLLIDLRSFHLAAGSSPTAQIEFGAKLLGGDGKILAGRLFQATAPAKGEDAPSATAAVNEAFAKAVSELVPWVSELLANPS
jgi:phospholipid/cholesterol/gamma-HCH transport system substrate-binding protein